MEKVTSHATDSILLKFAQYDLMINSVESFAYIEENCNYMLFII